MDYKLDAFIEWIGITARTAFHDNGIPVEGWVSYDGSQISLDYGCYEIVNGKLIKGYVMTCPVEKTEKLTDMLRGDFKPLYELFLLQKG